MNYNRHNLSVASRFALLAMILPVLMFNLFTATAVSAESSSRDMSYDRMQTFTGKSFVKDEHVWIYTKDFAEKFRMPASWVSEQLKGIEAAAFRIGESDLTCGLGGRVDNCARFQQCQLDIYIDEGKYPLPWITDKTADWLPGTDSFRFLFDSKKQAPGLAQIPSDIETDMSNQLHPFGDLETKRPAYYTQNAQTPNDESLNQDRILAYQRHISGNLTMIRLNYGCLTRNKRPYTSFWLVLKKKGWIGNLSKFPQKIYHHFQIPSSFEAQIDKLRESRNKIEEKKYMNILNQ